LVRDPVRRAQKYERKIDADAIRLRFEAQRDFMATQQNVMLPSLTNIETAVKQIVEKPPAGITVYTWQEPFYYNVGREIFGKVRRFTGDVLKQEVQLICNKWVSRGLNSELVMKIAALFGIEITAVYPAVY